jgi:nitrogen fixation protein NifZ
MMQPRFDYGEAVRVIRNIRNDGTYPGIATGALLVRRGSVGYVHHIGVFLQDQIIYAVHFIDDDRRLVGCREQELIPAAAPWVHSRFEVRDKVVARLALASNGKVLVSAGASGDVLKVLRDGSEEVAYYVCFGERILQVAEMALEEAPLGTKHLSSP